MTETGLRRLAKGVLIVTSTIFGVALVPVALASVMSLMAFDQGISLPAVLFAVAMLSLPPIILGTIPGSWICYRKRRYRAAIAVGLLPSLNILTVISLFVIVG